MFKLSGLAALEFRECVLVSAVCIVFNISAARVLASPGLNPNLNIVLAVAGGANIWLFFYQHMITACTELLHLNGSVSGSRHPAMISVLALVN